MSRTVITAVVAAVIATLTAIAFFVTSKGSDDRVRKDADAQATRAYQLVQRLNLLQVSDVRNKAERLSGRLEFVKALKATSGSESAHQASLGFNWFTSSDKEGSVKPDMIALVDANGDVVALDGTTAVPKMWRNAKADEKNPAMLPTILPALNVVLGKKVIISDIWNDDGKIKKIGVAPIIDPGAPAPITDPDGVVILGAVVVVYAQRAESAQQDKKLLNTEIAYFDNKRVVASSFTGASGTDEDTTKAAELSALLADGTISASQPKQRLSVGGVDYFVAAVKMPRSTTKELDPVCFVKDKANNTVKDKDGKDQEGRCLAKENPEVVKQPSLTDYGCIKEKERCAPCEKPADGVGTCHIAKYPPITAGAIVLSAATDTSGGAGKWFLVLLGVGAMAMAMLGIYLTHRRVVAQVDGIEQGVTDIINGNVDRTFRPVGPELDGLANGLNVMLARLLGRPEPGEEEFDEEGNPIIPGRVEFDEGEEGSRPSADPDLAALAQESEPDYYKRVFTEYQAARKAAGATDDGSFENFIAKLKVNEGKLKAQYQCRAVRFRVVTKDGKVSLKPVPIFA